MKKFKLIFRFILFIIILLLLLKVADFVCLYKINHEVDYYENQKVNYMIGEKLTVSYVQREEADYTILHKYDIVPEKGDKKRILVVGDSFVWGHSNRNFNTLFWNRLQYLLEQEGYNDVEIYAAGVSGIGTADEVNMILHNNETINRIKPDLIIFGMVLNDLDVDNVYDEDYIDEFDGYRFIYDHYNNVFYRLLNKFYPSLYSKLMNVLVTTRSTTTEFNEKYGSTYGYTFDYREKLYRTEKYINKFKDAVKEISEMDTKTIIFELFIGASTDFENGFLDLSKSVAEEYGVEFYTYRDLWEELYLEYNELFPQNAADGHPAEFLGNLYAEVLLDVLKNNYPEIIGEKSEVKEFQLEINDYLPYKIKLTRVSDNEYSFVYNIPEYLTYPLETDYIKLNLKYPMTYNKIVLESSNIKDAKIWYNEYMKDKDFIELEHNGLEFNVDGNEIYSLNIHIDLKNVDKNEKIIIRFE